MSWVYKLKSMDKEAPIYTLYRDLMMFDDPYGKDVKITKTAAGLNHWLIYDRKDIPVAITKMSFDSYTIPITKDGILPVKLFGRSLNVRSISKKASSSSSAMRRAMTWWTRNRRSHHSITWMPK